MIKNKKVNLHEKLDLKLFDNFLENTSISLNISILSLSAKFNQLNLLKYLLENDRWSKEELKEALKFSLKHHETKKILQYEIYKNNFFYKFVCCFLCLGIK